MGATSLVNVTSPCAPNAMTAPPNSAKEMEQRFMGASLFLLLRLFRIQPDLLQHFSLGRQLFSAGRKLIGAQDERKYPGDRLAIQRLGLVLRHRGTNSF